MYPSENFGLEINPSESELFRAIPKSVSESIRFYSIYYASIRGNNMNESKPSFQSESFRPRINSDCKFYLDQS